MPNIPSSISAPRRGVRGHTWGLGRGGGGSLPTFLDPCLEQMSVSERIGEGKWFRVLNRDALHSSMHGTVNKAVQQEGEKELEDHLRDCGGECRST